MPYDREILAQTIRGARRRRGLTQEVLSGLAGLARSHLAEIESGATCPGAETLWRIAEALGMKPSALVREAEERMEKGAEALREDG